MGVGDAFFEKTKHDVAVDKEIVSKKDSVPTDGLTTVTAFGAKEEKLESPVEETNSAEEHSVFSMSSASPRVDEDDEEDYLTAIGAVDTGSAEEPVQKEAAFEEPEQKEAAQGDVKLRLPSTAQNRSIEPEAPVREEQSLFDRFVEDPEKTVFGFAQTFLVGISYALGRRSIRKIMRTGTLVQSGDFEFVKTDKELILKAYKGVSNVVNIPRTVGKLPVTQISPDFLVSGSNPFDNYKTRSVKAAIQGVTLSGFDIDETNTFFSDINEVILPDTIRVILSGTFSGCYGLKRIVIPSSVVRAETGAFQKCGIREIFFLGDLPDGFDVNAFRGDVYQYLKGFDDVQRTEVTQ